MSAAAPPLAAARECTPAARDARRPADLLAAAGEVAARITMEAREGKGGAVAWAAPEGGALGLGLYDGLPGVVLFLAALDHVRARDEYRELALRALGPLRRALAELAADPGRAARLRVGVGGMTGAGGWVYAFTRIAAWLEEPALLEDAHRAAALIDPARVASDRQLDVVGGCAGALLTLLALDEAAPEEPGGGTPPIERARTCGARLLEARVAEAGRPRAWPGEGHPPLTGFAHGAAGISHALFRLAARTGDEVAREAAREGLAYERSLFDPDRISWWDPRFGRPVEQSAWCHGAPGIALARAASADAAGPAVAEEARELLHGVRAAPPPPLDHLCCGGAGMAEVLLSAGEALEDGELRGAAREVMEGVLERARGAGDFRLSPPGEPEAFRPGLFRGLAGVGYACVRMAAPPGVLPSPLLLG